MRPTLHSCRRRACRRSGSRDSRQRVLRHHRRRVAPRQQHFAHLISRGRCCRVGAVTRCHGAAASARVDAVWQVEKRRAGHGHRGIPEWCFRSHRPCREAITAGVEQVNLTSAACTFVTARLLCVSRHRSAAVVMICLCVELSLSLSTCKANALERLGGQAAAAGLLATADLTGGPSQEGVRVHPPHGGQRPDAPPGTISLCRHGEHRRCGGADSAHRLCSPCICRA